MAKKRAQDLVAALAAGDLLVRDSVIQNLFAAGLIFRTLEAAQANAEHRDDVVRVALGRHGFAYLIVTTGKSDDLSELSLYPVDTWHEREAIDPKSNKISHNTRSIAVYKWGVDRSGRSDKKLEIAWKGRDFGMTAAEYFQEHFASTPLAERPFADDVRRASPRFYHALATFQSQRGQSINDLFPADPAARGGAKIKMGPDPTYEELLARRDRERESTRIRVANWRRRKRLEAS